MQYANRIAFIAFLYLLQFQYKAQNVQKFKQYFALHHVRNAIKSKKHIAYICEAISTIPLTT